MAKVSLVEFWNANDVTSLFLVGNGCPAGKEIVQNLEDEGEDYCDLSDVIDTGLFAQPEDGSQPWWDLEGEVKDGVWSWDGEGSIRDNRGNDYTKIEAR